MASKRIAELNAQLRRAYSATSKLSEVRRVTTMGTSRLPFINPLVNFRIRNSANVRPESIDGHKLIQSGCLHSIAEIGF